MPIRRLSNLRRRTNGAVVDSFFRGASRLGKMHPLARPDRHGLEVIRDRRYRSSLSGEHFLDVYRPKDADGPLPVVLYIHGGGFRILSKDTHWLMGLAFARRGAVVFNIGYRLAPEHRFPAAIEDVCAAYEWVVKNAAAYGGDVSRMVVAGESAGANLATSVTLASVYQREEGYARAVYETGVVPVATLPACGIFQVSDVQRFARRKDKFPRLLLDQLQGVEHSYLGKQADRYGSSLDLADPVSWLERQEKPDRPLPPFLLTVGTKDPLLPDTRRMKTALDDLGARCDAKYYEGEVHAFHAFVFRKNAQRCWQHHFEFLDEHVPTGATRSRDEGPTGPRPPRA